MFAFRSLGAWERGYLHPFSYHSVPFPFRWEGLLTFRARQNWADSVTDGRRRETVNQRIIRHLRPSHSCIKVEFCGEERDDADWTLRQDVTIFIYREGKRGLLFGRRQRPWFCGLSAHPRGWERKNRTLGNSCSLDTPRSGECSCIGTYSYVHVELPLLHTSRGSAVAHASPVHDSWGY